MRFLNWSILLICFILATSCSLQKRHYRNGYHVVWNHQKVSDQKKEKVSHIETTSSAQNVTVETVVVSSKQTYEEAPVLLKKKPTLILGKDTCADVLWFKNGDKLIGKVLEVSNEHVKYKRCDNLDGPVFTTRKGALAKLTYFNGIEEDLDVPQEVKQPDKEKADKRETNTLGLVSFILACFGLFLGITSVASIPLAMLSLGQFKESPDRYSDRWMPIAALGINLGLTLVLCLIFLSVYTYTGIFLGLTVYFGALSLLSIIGFILYV